MVDYSKAQRGPGVGLSGTDNNPTNTASSNNIIDHPPRSAPPGAEGVSTAEVDAARQKLWDAGIAVRRQVVGDAHVERSLAAASASALSAHNLLGSAQQLATEVGWGMIWTRPGLTRQTRSFMNLAMLLALGRSSELGVHVRGAVRNGLSVAEIREALLHASVYAGLPAGLEGFRAAERVLSEMVEKGELEVKAKL